MEFLRILEEIDDLRDLFLRFITTRNIFEGGRVFLTGEHLSFAFAKAHSALTSTLELTHEEEIEQANDEQKWKEADQYILKTCGGTLLGEYFTNEQEVVFSQATTGRETDLRGELGSGRKAVDHVGQTRICHLTADNVAITAVRWLWFHNAIVFGDLASFDRFDELTDCELFDITCSARVGEPDR